MGPCLKIWWNIYIYISISYTRINFPKTLGLRTSVVPSSYDPLVSLLRRILELFPLEVGARWITFSIYCIPQQIGGSNGQIELRDTVSVTTLVEEGWKKPPRIIAGNCLLIFWPIDIPHVGVDFGTVPIGWCRLSPLGPLFQIFMHIYCIPRKIVGSKGQTSFGGLLI